VLDPGLRAGVIQVATGASGLRRSSPYSVFPFFGQRLAAEADLCADL